MNFVLKHFCEEVSAPAAMAVRGLVGTLVLFPVFWSSRRIYITRSGTKIWLRSLAGAASVICLFTNLKQTSVGDATTLANLSPVFVILLQVIFLKEKITRGELIGTLVVVVGVASLSSPEVNAIPLRAVVVGLSGAISAAVAYLTLKRASRDFTSREIVWAFCLTMILGAALFGGIGDTLDLVATARVGLRPWSGLIWAVVAGLLGLLAQILMTKAFVGLPALIAASLPLSMVVWGVVLESIYIREAPGVAAVMSYLAVLGGLVLLQYSRRGSSVE